MAQLLVMRMSGVVLKSVMRYFLDPTRFRLHSVTIDLATSIFIPEKVFWLRFKQVIFHMSSFMSMN